ncbi:DEAD/DEAH box helicase [Hydrogenoanaerobacterium sp.]|uniref:DEAD/DEAH box helicase n=1 Tax=Hydrogenoanaerobacterium sp. TaxID=2953763 RepID=UPI0028A0AA83|nr:DEAD/DEAH box helicase [Hydrogenoanaerobacterium sp.]
MNQIPFLQLDLIPEIQRAVDAMGFETATDIQSQSIPLIQNGYDVIGRSQTGTGKTIAFGIPAIEKIDTREAKPHVQVLILCPTRELAMQACEEIKKLGEFMPGIKTADVYGGAPMDRQILKLKRANIVIGTPGRVMDHMRRKTLKLNHLKMIVLDEADEMLSMGFREDIETILQDTPEERQTILFSATMPPAIMALTKQYQKDPQLVEIDKKQVTVENIEQYFYDVPMGRKMDALNLIIKYHNPKLAMIFCNTKAMVDEITDFLEKQGFNAEGLHGDMKQSQRTKVMDSFKYGKTSIMVATDVAARGIDVNDIDYVINYDIPQNSEYYVHRIGRTGRAGKSGVAITLCSGRRQVDQLMITGRMTKSKIIRSEIPNAKDILVKIAEQNMASVEEFIQNTPELAFSDMVERLNEKGFAPEVVAAALMEMHFGRQDLELKEIKANKPKERIGGAPLSYSKIVLNIGRSSRVAPNHIVGAITERTNLSGKDIGKIEIYDERSIVGIPTDDLEATVSAMQNSKICGKPTTAAVYETRERSGGYQPRRGAPQKRDGYRKDAPKKDGYKKDFYKKDGGKSDDQKDYRSLSKKRYHKDRA